MPDVAFYMSPNYAMVSMESKVVFVLEDCVCAEIHPRNKGSLSLGNLIKLKMHPRNRVLFDSGCKDAMTKHSHDGRKTISSLRPLENGFEDMRNMA